MSRQINRDPFARTTLFSETVAPVGGQICDWCGNLNSRGKLFRYSTEADAIRPRRNDHRGLFCSKSCHNAYHS